MDKQEQYLLRYEDMVAQLCDMFLDAGIDISEEEVVNESTARAVDYMHNEVSKDAAYESSLPFNDISTSYASRNNEEDPVGYVDEKEDAAWMLWGKIVRTRVLSLGGKISRSREDD
jgi:hypothetical protein